MNLIVLAQSAPPQGNPIGMIVPALLTLLIMYVIFIRPRIKSSRRRKRFANLTAHLGAYVCPRCDSKETYIGTELVGTTKGGAGMVGPETDLGVSPVIVSKTTSVEQHSIRKCKKCDSILGDKDFLYTDAEKLELQRIAKELKVKI